MSKLDKDQVIAKFTQAYTAAHGKSAEITAKGGWYSVDGGKNMRLAQLNQLADELNANAMAAKPVKSTKSTHHQPANKEQGAFSVKTYWANKIQSQQPGVRTPR